MIVFKREREKSCRKCRYWFRDDTWGTCRKATKHKWRFPNETCGSWKEK